MSISWFDIILTAIEDGTIRGSWVKPIVSLCIIFATSYMNLGLFQNKNLNEKDRLMSVVLYLTTLPSSRLKHRSNDFLRGPGTKKEPAQGAPAELPAPPVYNGRT